MDGVGGGASSQRFRIRAPFQSSWGVYGAVRERQRIGNTEQGDCLTAIVGILVYRHSEQNYSAIVFFFGKSI